MTTTPNRRAGRPSTRASGHSILVTMRMDVQLLRALDRLARRAKLPRNTALERAVEDYVAQNR
jgi:predicted transcriptional regulator